MIDRVLKIFAVLCFVLAASIQPAAAQAFQAGAATSNITPPLGRDIIGGFCPSPSTHVHDELHARCLVLDDGQDALAFVVCDLVGIHDLVCDEARKLIAAALQDSAVARADLGHAHAFGLERPGQRSLSARRRRSTTIRQFVAQRIADGVACADQQPAAGRDRPSARPRRPEHVFNRRWYHEAGHDAGESVRPAIDQVKMNPGAGSANLVEPAGPTDPTISFLAVREPGGQPISVFAAYSLHYVGGVGNGAHLGRLLRRLCERAGAAARTPSGTIRRSSASWPTAPAATSTTSTSASRGRGKKPYEQMRYVADDVAAKVHAALGKVQYQGRRHARRPLPRADDRLAASDATSRSPGPKKTIAAGRESRAAPTCRSSMPSGRCAWPSIPRRRQCRCKCCAIGDVCIGTMPVRGLHRDRPGIQAEVLAQQPAFMVELANGSFGYLPTPRQHKLGGYETWLGTNRLEIEASDKMLAELLAMSEELKAKK